MKILVTGSAGRVGRALCLRLAAQHEVVGLDLAPSSTTDVVASITDAAACRAAMRGAHAVIHSAALHAPHVGHHPDHAFEAINVEATGSLARWAVEAGVQSFVFTSTTALYGAGSTADTRAAWVDEATVPRPLTVYHRSKLAAEATLEGIARETGLPVTVLRMARCFPEPAPLMALYRLCRGVDVRDVADAHACAATRPAPGWRRFIVSGTTPFRPEDTELLRSNAPEAIAQRCPALAEAFHRRRWTLPRSIDRVYSPLAAAGAHPAGLDWQAARGFEEVLAQLDRGSPEVLPAAPTEGER